MTTFLTNATDPDSFVEPARRRLAISQARIAEQAFGKRESLFRRFDREVRVHRIYAATTAHEMRGREIDDVRGQFLDV